MMLDRRIKFRHIQCFVEINRQKSLKKAAEALHLTQPAVSKTLKELEDVLETELLIRSRAGVALTGSGEVFLQFAQMSLATLQQGLDGIAAMREGGKVMLRIGALPSVAARLLPSVVQHLIKLAPDVTVFVQDGTLEHLVDDLRVGRLDLVVGRLGRPNTMTGISFTQLYNEHVIFAVRPGHPLLDDPHLANLVNWTVIYPPEGSAIRPLVDRMMISQGIGSLPRRIESVSGAFGRNYVHSSDAVWIISAGVVDVDLSEERLVALPIGTPMTTGPVGIMTSADQKPLPTMRLFNRAVGHAMDELALWDTPDGHD